MSEYLVSVIAVCIISVLAVLISYGAASEKTLRAAVGMILIYTIVSPIKSLVADLDTLEIPSFDTEQIALGDSEYYRVAKESFSHGVALFVEKEFEIELEDMEVTVYGFDVKKMQAQKIRISLTGRGALAHTQRIEEAVEKEGLGECEVTVRFD